MFNREQSTYNLILEILALIVLIMPFTGKINDGRNKWYKLKIRGWIMCSAFILSIIINYCKDKQTEKEDAAKIKAAKIEKRKDDSISRKRNDESNAKIVNTFVTSLAKYGLKYDSTQKIIQKLVLDSSKKETKIIAKNNPELSISNIELEKLKNDTLFIAIALHCDQATAYNIKIKLYTIALNNNTFSLSKGLAENAFNTGEQIPPGFTSTAKISYSNSSNLKRLYFLFKGTYTNLDGKVLPYHELLDFDVNGKVFGTLIDLNIKQKITSLYNQYGINY